MIKRKILLTFLVFCTIISPICYAKAAEPQLSYQIHGVKNHSLRNNILARLNQQQDNLAKPTSAAALMAFYEKSPQEITLAMQPFGYFKPTIQKKLTQKDEIWVANYTIDPGPRLKITAVNITFSGAGKADFETLVPKLPLQANQPLVMEDYEQTKQALYAHAEQTGYLTAHLTTHSIQIDLENYTARVELHLETGPRYYFGDVIFEKNPLSPRFLEKFVPFKKGEPYQGDAVLKFQDALASSNYYSQVTVHPNMDKAQNQQVPVDVNLVPKEKYQYKFGLGYGTDTGARGLAGWEWRYVTDTGHKFSTQLQVSQVQSQVSAIYTIPGTNPLTDQINLSTSMYITSLPEGYSRMHQLGINHVRTKNHWQQMLYLNYQLEHFQLNNEPYQNSKALLPGATWTYTKADNLIFPRNGHKFSFNVVGAAKALLSDNDLLQFEVKDKYIKSLTPKSRLILRGDIGYSIVNDLNSLPLTLQFFTGGTQSVRGYNYQSLGAGRYLTTGSVEYQHELFKKVYGVLFYDVGNAYNDMNEPLMSGAGAGLMWVSPVGPMELTVGRALSKQGNPNLIQFSMGPDL